MSEGPSLTPAPAQSSSSPSLKSVRIVDPRENNTYVDTTNESAGKVVAQEMYSDPDSPMSKNCLNASHTGRERGTEDSELLTDYKDERSSDDTGTHTLDAQPSPCLHVHISSPGTPPPLQSSTSGTEWTSQTSLSPASVHNMASFGSLDSSSIGASANANQYNTWSSVRSVSHDEYYAGEGGVQADSDSGKGAEEMSSFLVKEALDLNDNGEEGGGSSRLQEEIGTLPLATCSPSVSPSAVYGGTSEGLEVCHTLVQENYMDQVVERGTREGAQSRYQVAKQAAPTCIVKDDDVLDSR